MADAAWPFTFRHDPAGGGALADIGSHALATAEFLRGFTAEPITKVMGDCVTVIAERPDGKGGRRAVEVDDVGRAFLRFGSGATGSIEANWIATGRNDAARFRGLRDEGSACSSPRSASTSCTFSPPTIGADARGFAASRPARIIRPMGNSAAPGHQLGFNDLKAIEVAGFLEALSGGRPEPFGFRAGSASRR